jgi:hypothetical protein
VLNVQTVCQHYPPEPEDLALTEEYAVTRGHPIGMILLNSFRNPVAFCATAATYSLYHRIRALFLDILPSPALQFHDHIKSNTEPPVRSTIKLSAWSLRLSYYLCTRRQGFAGIQS